MSFASAPRTTSSACSPTPTTRNSRSPNSSMPRVLLARRSGGPSTSRQYWSRPDSRNASAQLHRDQPRPSPEGRPNSRYSTVGIPRADPSIRRPRPSHDRRRRRHQRPPRDRHLWKRRSWGSRPTERYRLLRGRRWQPDDSPPADNRRRRRSQSERFDGDRFVFEPYVESAESAGRAGSKLHEIFAEGITVYGSDRLDEIRKGGRRR